jgi:hypothetical protein
VVGRYAAVTAAGGVVAGPLLIEGVRAREVDMRAAVAGDHVSQLCAPFT